MASEVNDKQVDFESRSFYKKNRTKICEIAAVVGLAIGLVGLGVMIAGMATSPHWYYRFFYQDGHRTSDNLPYTYDPPFNYQPGRHIPPNLDNADADHIEWLCQYGARVGAIGLAATITGFALFIVMLCLRYQSKKEDAEREKKDTLAVAHVDPTDNDVAGVAKTKRNAYIMMGVGAVIALFALGMVIGASTILNNTVPDMHKIIDQGREANNLPSYDTGFWDNLERDWLNPTQTHMTAIASVFPFIVLGGAGLFGAGLLTKGGSSCFFGIKEWWRESQSRKRGI